VIHGYHRIVMTSIRIIKERVGTQRPDDIDSCLARGADSRVDDGRFFRSQLPAFTRMGIEATNANAGPRQAQIAASLCRKLNGDLHFVDGQMVGNIFKRQMGGGQCYAQPPTLLVRSQQHHCRAARWPRGRLV